MERINILEQCTIIFTIRVQTGIMTVLKCYCITIRTTNDTTKYKIRNKSNPLIFENNLLNSTFTSNRKKINFKFIL